MPNQPFRKSALLNILNSNGWDSVSWEHWQLFRLYLNKGNYDNLMDKSIHLNMHFFDYQYERSFKICLLIIVHAFCPFYWGIFLLLYMIYFMAKDINPAHKFPSSLLSLELFIIQTQTWDQKRYLELVWNKY